jgi:hypothetical protein
MFVASYEAHHEVILYACLYAKLYVVHMGCLGDALGMPWRCPGDALEMPGGCPGDARGMPWGCPGDALEMPWRYPGGCPGDLKNPF